MVNKELAEDGKLLSRLEWPYISLKLYSVLTILVKVQSTYPSISKAFHVQINKTTNFSTFVNGEDMRLS